MIFDGVVLVPFRVKTPIYCVVCLGQTYDILHV